MCSGFLRSWFPVIWILSSAPALPVTRLGHVPRLCFELGLLPPPSHFFWWDITDICHSLSFSSTSPQSLASNHLIPAPQDPSCYSNDTVENVLALFSQTVEKGETRVSELGNWLNLKNESRGSRNTPSKAFHNHGHNHTSIFPAFGQRSTTGRGRGSRFDFFFFFLKCKRNSSLQVFAYTCQKVSLRHSRLCHLNSECRTTYVEDRNQCCITILRLRVTPVGRWVDSNAGGPLSPRDRRVTRQCN